MCRPSNGGPPHRSAEALPRQQAKRAHGRERALEAFPGSIILISHDRASLEAVAERKPALEEGAIRSLETEAPGYIDLPELDQDNKPVGALA